jgi:UDP-galactopyranose mutase
LTENYNLVVGAGFSGAIIAREIADELNEHVIIIDRRNHIGGTSYDFVNEEGLLVPLYGPHYFHTCIERVWKYVNRFAEWKDYNHRVLSKVDGKYVPIPVNITTVNELFGEHISTEEEMKAWLQVNTEHISAPKNSEETALNRVGRKLYEKLFRNYTRKQWGMDPSEMDPLVLSRIPVRTTFEDRYFTDSYQGMPIEGYTRLFERILDNPLIELRLNTDYREVKHQPASPIRTIFTGRIDEFFEGVVKEPLQYRSLHFEFETYDKEEFQPTCTVNYPEASILFTRISEPKKAMGQENPKTTIIKEYPAAHGEPYYPVFTPRTKQILANYQDLAEDAESKDVYFLGRLAQYKYLNMDQTIDNALSLFERLKR